MESEGLKHLIVAGGGTGGHVLAGIAVADSWRERWGDSARVTFVGAYGGIEETLVPRAGYPLKLLHLGSLSRVSIWERIKTVFQLPFSFARSLSILMNERPQAVLGVGGYASGPLVLMARLLSVFHGFDTRTAILEQNAVPGFTNRVLGHFVHRIFSCFPITDGSFPESRIQVTGNPVRSSMKRMPAAKRDPFTIFIFGGSQGAVGINTLVLNALSELGDLKARIRFIHQTGETDYQRVLDAYKKAGVSARVEKFVYDMPAAYAEASLLICRAGSSTLAEIASVGRAAVLIPFPFASDNHQEKNARIFSDVGAARLLVQQDAKPSDLSKLVRDLVTSPGELTKMEEAVTRFYRPGAAQEIVSKLSG